MRPLTGGGLRGVWGTVLLPLRDDDTIDFGRLGEQLDRLAAAGLNGIYAHGTAGEFNTLDGDEYDRINELVAASGVPFQIGASHPGAQATLDRVRRAKHLAPGAFQVILPDWVRLHDDEAVAFLTRVAEEADPVPLVLYNPPHAKTPVPPALLSRLAAAVPSLVGTKTAGGDRDWFRAMRDAAPDRAIFVPGHTLASGLALGAHGSYSNVAAMSPAGAVRWYETALRARPPAWRSSGASTRSSPRTSPRCKRTDCPIRPSTAFWPRSAAGRTPVPVHDGHFAAPPTAPSRWPAAPLATSSRSCFRTDPVPRGSAPPRLWLVSRPLHHQK
ncbi:dihydrodipicolinate synthase family protein [Phytohabitans sp. LJ34]|uniref:dihydrodipicolinate synthase family protein n=1 Tax=Phytohabitans sp. LJ34 TaxID=3452217 RepID=UPI003F8BC885